MVQKIFTLGKNFKSQAQNQNVKQNPKLQIQIFGHLKFGILLEIEIWKLEIASFLDY